MKTPGRGMARRTAVSGKETNPLRQLEVFFDYACPYCLRGHRFLKSLVPRYPDVAVVWRPCEAHPRPDPYGPHSHLCIQGFFFMKDCGADLWAYHDRMFRAALIDRADIEDVRVLARYAEGLADTHAFCGALRAGTYRRAQLEANAGAWDRQRLAAVPSYRMDGRRLDSVEDVGVTEQQLARFLAGGLIR